MAEKKKLEMQSVQPVVGGKSEDGDPVNNDVWTYKWYCRSCQQEGLSPLSFDQWEQFGMPAAWQVSEYGKYRNNCGAQSLIPFNFEEWLQLGGTRNPTFKEPDI